MHYNGLLLSSILMMMTSLPAASQENASVNLGLVARIDYQREYLEGSALDSGSGFRGKNVSVLADGRLGEHFSYKYRQRLYREHGAESFFNATDHLFLTYRLDDRWSFSAGKQTVQVGGYEYDLAPFDAYFLSEYNSSFSCYRFAVNANYDFNGGKDRLTGQVCQSPAPGGENDLYAYNLMWTGNHGHVGTLWSANLLEYSPGIFMSYLALGTRFTFGDFSLFIDYMNRSLAEKVTFLRDFTVIGKLMYSFKDKLNVFAKVSYDCNDLEDEGDWCILPGTSVTRAGAGLEYFPLSDRKLRLHATFCCNFGKNGNASGSVMPDRQIINLGVTWNMHFLTARR